MELTWLHDFLVLAELRNFTRAAAARHVTQPAFSRRIRALEEWIGTPLLDRAPQGVTLTAAGTALRDHAAGLVREVEQMRRAALREAGRERNTLSIAATHALSFTFFPGWIRRFPALGGLNLVSDTMAACERILLAGEADFLLCHHRAQVPNGVAGRGFASRLVGRDMLVPVHAPGAAPVPLAYSAASGLGRILAAAGRATGAMRGAAFTAPLAATLHQMARQGHGLAWLPRTMAAEDLASGCLIETGAAPIDVEIRLFRPSGRGSAAAEAFWAALPQA